MDDNDSKPPRRPGARPGGARTPEGRRSERPSGKKPFAKRRDEGGEKPRRDFAGKGKPWVKRGDAPQEGKRPFAKRPYGERKPSEDGRSFKDRPGRRERAERSEGDVRSERTEAPRGERKPFVKREDRKPFGERAHRKPFGERPARKPFREGEERKPFRERKPFEGSQDRKPFDKGKEPRGGERRPFRDDKERRPFKRPEHADDDRRPFRPRAEPAEEAAGERIAKRLARAGIASRRDAEELIAAGRVKVNGKVLSSPAVNVLASDVIHLDGTEIPPVERTRMFLFHKPAGVVTTNRDPEGRKTVFDVLPADLPRLMTIGRLDINTEGLLLLTNDGGLSRVLELPATGWLRRYRVRVHGRVDEQALAGLKDGIAVDGVFYGAVEASLERTQGTNAWLTIGLREGKNREVKNILGALGLEVTRLIRVSYGPFQLGELPEGHVLEIKGRMLRDQLGDRLIEESGANFDADIVKPFSNKPVRRNDRAEDMPRPSSTRHGERAPIGEGGLIKNRKRRENSREEALGKLSTRPDRPAFDKRGDKPGFGGKPAGSFGGKPGRKGEREERPIEPPGQRRANVWMAPGARPQGGKKGEAPESSPRRERRPAKPSRPKTRK